MRGDMQGAGDRDFKAIDCVFMMEVPVTPSMYSWKKNELS